MTPISTMHLTMCLLRIESVPHGADLMRARRAMETFSRTIFRVLVPTNKSVRLAFRGLASFNNRVVFTKLDDSGNQFEILKQISENLYRCFEVCFAKVWFSFILPHF